MGAKDRRVDAYIRKSPAFAQPILTELRARVHSAVPGVAETIKWGMPYFMYKDALFAGMSAFKAHCGFGFWHPRMRSRDKSLEGIGQYGKVTSLGQLPSRAEFARLAKRAKRLADDGVKGPPRPKRDPARKIAVPRDFAGALAKNAKARATFGGFSYARRKEYVGWIQAAKRDETRARRIATSVQWLSEGKPQGWKYEMKP